MPLFFERNDITKIYADAICFSSFSSPKVGAGADKAIYKAAGKYKLISERKRFGELNIGESISTAAYDLPARNLIHTVVPEFVDGNQGEYEALQECYTGALKRARELKCESIAFTLLGAGAAGFPKMQAFHIAMSAIRKFLTDNDMTVVIVVYDNISFDMSTKISAAVDEYKKRLSRYCNLDIIEIEPVRLSDNPSKSEIDNALEREAENVLKKVPANSTVFSLCVEGKQMSSEQFAQKIDEQTNAGKSIVFIIGSSYGLSERVKKSSNIRLSVSDMTFPHQLFRVMLLEQIYRAFKINEGSAYHK